MSLIVVNGDNLELLKKYPDNYFDAVITDPPYGLGKEPDAVEVMTAWATTGYHEIEGKGFMGKEWDAFVPQPIFWKEVFRVLKHGGHVLAFYGTRTYDWGVMAMRFAGFEVRDCIQWIYGSGFPKSHNIGKAVDKLQGKEVFIGKGFNVAGQNVGLNQNKELRSDHPNYVKPVYQNKWDGWGSALKPANEPIVLARKPLEKGLSIAENVLKWGVGGINIDKCRVGIEERSFNSKGIRSGFGNYVGDSNFGGQGEISVNGRFPANIILTHHPECECKGLKKVKAIKGGCKFESAFFKSGESNFTKEGGIGDADGNETVEDWNCHPDCPIKIMDEQSGESKSMKAKRGNGIGIGYNGSNNQFDTERGINDSGGASRFFYCAKASKSERNKGLESFEPKQMAWSNQAKAELKRGNTEFSDKTKMHNKVQERINFHPTVKPVKLMQYLVRLITPPNGKVLDPFCGSGTTGVACKLEGFEFVGMEQDPEYTKIAEARIANHIEEKQETLKEIEQEDGKKQVIKYIQANLFN